MTAKDDIRAILSTTLQLGPRGEQLTRESPLLGALPEFDSMAVVTVINALEERYGIVIEDDEMEAATFETLGSLTDFVDAKLRG